MSCQRLDRSARPAGWLHRLQCAECRAARAADASIAFVVSCFRAEPAPAGGLARVLTALSSERAPFITRARLRRVRNRRVAGRLALGAIVLTASGFGWVWYANQDPNIPVPSHPMPRRNAFDLFTSAGAQLVGDASDGDALTNAVVAAFPQSSGAKPVSKKQVDSRTTGEPAHTATPPGPAGMAAGAPAIAGPLMSPAGGATAGMPGGPAPGAGTATLAAMPGAPAGGITGPMPTMPGSTQDKPALTTLAEWSARLDVNRGALRTLRQGLELPYQNPPARSFSVLFPYYARDRALARLLALEQAVRVVRGDWGGAMSSGLDAIEMGAKLPHGSELIGRLVGIAIEAIGRSHTWDVVGHLPGVQARAALRRMEQAEQERTPLWATMQEEEWMGQAGLQEVMRKRGWRSALELGSDADDTVAAHIKADILYVEMLPYRKRDILTNYTRYMSALVGRARLPYFAAASAPSLVPGNDPINAILAPDFEGVGLREAINTAEDRLLLVALALRAYRCEHGRYPPSLASLAPGYLTSVPADPFAPTRSLRYVMAGQKYLLYSVGPDGSDNGGRPITTHTRYATEIEQNSIGDIVAGVTRP